MASRGGSIGSGGNCLLRDKWGGPPGGALRIFSFQVIFSAFKLQLHAAAVFQSDELFLCCATAHGTAREGEGDAVSGPGGCWSNRIPLVLATVS